MAERPEIKIPSRIYLPRHNFLIDLNRLIREEWWITGSHFIYEDSERPPIDSFVVAFRENDFGGKVFGSAAERPGASLDAFGETEIGYLAENEDIR